MAKLSQQNTKNTAINRNNTTNGVTKVKRTRRSVPRDSPPQRSSIYRGVTRHRWTGRYEAHLWDKNCWNESQNKKGRQVYLGAYDDEEVAAHAYDLAALKYWGPETILNFPLSTYQNQLKEMEGRSREEYIGSLRRKSSRGVSKYRGVSRHHHNGGWEARIGRVFATQEEAAAAYGIEHRGLNADLSRYIKWLKPNQNNSNGSNDLNLPTPMIIGTDNSTHRNPNQELGPTFLHNEQTYQPSETTLIPLRPAAANPTSALGLLLQSSKFKEMMEMTSVTDCPQTSSSELELTPCSFPEDVQTYFECQYSSSYGDQGDDMIFGDYNSFMPPMFHSDF
ncbi:AP2-like ethylene-responsive transcription factor At1g79700 [Populus nigra]|uniref:AP2-like ethylene-responsive transcription factor At1g79700 n=1 Tax=Populus nigra TaxID=3691 RepID=UPI002B268880|nr:AP2-like ethylene-responsive transcription factor At1g79700 [Populus nigra]